MRVLPPPGRALLPESTCFCFELCIDLIEPTSLSGSLYKAVRYSGERYTANLGITGEDQDPRAALEAGTESPPAGAGDTGWTPDLGRPHRPQGSLRLQLRRPAHPGVYLRQERPGRGSSQGGHGCAREGTGQPNQFTVF